MRLLICMQCQKIMKEVKVYPDVNIIEARQTLVNLQRGVKREAQTRNHNAGAPVHTAPTQTQASAGAASYAAHSHLPGDAPLLCVRCRRVQLCIGKLELGRRSILRPHAQGRRPPNLTKDRGESRIPSDVPQTPPNARFHATRGGHHTPWDKRCAGSSEARET